LRRPFHERVRSYVEVYGKVDKHLNIICDKYVFFDDSLTENFDMDFYNETIELTFKLPDIYIQDLKHLNID